MSPNHRDSIHKTIGQVVNEVTAAALLQGGDGIPYDQIGQGTEV